MSKSKEFISDSDDSSEEDVKPEKKQKREKHTVIEKPSKKMKKEEEKEDESIWDLGNNRQVNVREFKGKLYVDIREMYYDKDGDLKPGKKGICLNMIQWRKFMSVVEDVDRVAKSKC